MLAKNAYPQDFIDGCRAKVAAQVAAYDAVAASAGSEAEGPLATFEPLFFTNLVLVLDSCFLHRARGQEGKDGNAMNEVRLLCSSILENDGVLVADKQIKLKPETSVLGLASGDPVVLDHDRFVALAEAYFTAIEGAYGDG